MLQLPFNVGATDTTYEQELAALKTEFEGILDTSDGTELEIELRGDALAADMIWAVNRRVANQNNPRRMLENLPVWETVLRLRPVPTDSDADRRRRVGARMRGFTGNARPDIEAAAESALGVNYDEVRRTAPDDQITYWPAVNPGPPGFEFSSNRAHIGIVMNKNGLSESQWRDKRDAIVEIMSELLPDWMTYTIGTGSQFAASSGGTATAGVVGQVFL